VEDRLPDEPLVVVPYDSIGSMEVQLTFYQMQLKLVHQICYQQDT
jgi:hypothetical protein